MTQQSATRSGPGVPALLGIDLGTSSVKAVVTDVEGGVLGQAESGYDVRSPHPGWSETDPLAWLSSTTAAVRAAVVRARADIVAIGFSGQMHGIVAADRTGTPVRPAMLWSDARAIDQLRLYDDLAPHVRSRLANPLSPGMAGPLLSWLRRHEPQAYAATRWALSPKDWLRSRLTDEFHTEPSDASATLLYDLLGDTWDFEVLDVLGLDAATFASVLSSSGHPAGELTSAAAELLGLRPGIPVAAGAADTAAAALGSALVDPATAQLTIGTGAQVIRPVAALPTPLPSSPVTHLYRTADESGWYGMAAGLNGGSTLSWVRDVLGASWQEVYASAALLPRDDAPVFLPHLHGERTPYLDPRMRGAWTDLGPAHRREDLLYAALEGVAFAVREATDCLLSSGPDVPGLRLAGGGTTAPAWRQMLADILERPLTPIEVPAASGLGATILARRAIGLPEPPRQHGLAGSEPTVHPRPERSLLHHDRYTAYRERVASLRPAGPTQLPLPEEPFVPSGLHGP